MEGDQSDSVRARVQQTTDIKAETKKGGGDLTLKSRVLGPQVLDSILDLTWSQMPSSLLFWLTDLQVQKPAFTKR